MAVDIYLKLGPIKGESKGGGHEQEIDVQSFSWGMSNSSNAHATGGGSGAGKSTFQDLTISHFTDKASVDLVKYLATGKIVPEGTLYVREAGGATPVEYLKLTMHQIFITNLHAGAHASQNGNEKVMETVTLNFAKFKLEYTEQTDTGGKGATPNFGYDIRKVAEM